MSDRPHADSPTWASSVTTEEHLTDWDGNVALMDHMVKEHGVFPHRNEPDETIMETLLRQHRAAHGPEWEISLVPVGKLHALMEMGIAEVEASTALAHYGDDSPLGKTFTALIDALLKAPEYEYAIRGHGLFIAADSEVEARGLSKDGYYAVLRRPKAAEWEEV